MRKFVVLFFILLIFLASAEVCFGSSKSSVSSRKKPVKKSSKTVASSTSKAVAGSIKGTWRLSSSSMSLKSLGVADKSWHYLKNSAESEEVDILLDDKGNQWYDISFRFFKDGQKHEQMQVSGKFTGSYNLEDVDILRGGDAFVLNNNVYSFDAIINDKDSTFSIKFYLTDSTTLMHIVETKTNALHFITTTVLKRVR